MIGRSGQQTTRRSALDSLAATTPSVAHHQSVQLFPTVGHWTVSRGSKAKAQISLMKLTLGQRHCERFAGAPKPHTEFGLSQSWLGDEVRCPGRIEKRFCQCCSLRLPGKEPNSLSRYGEPSLSPSFALVRSRSLARGLLFFINLISVAAQQPSKQFWTNVELR